MKTIKLLRIIHLAVLLEALAFFAIVLFLKSDETLVWMSEENPELFIVGLVTAMVSGLFAFVVPRAMLNKVRSVENEKDRVKAYVPVAIVRYAFMDAAISISIVFFMITDSLIFTVVLTCLVFVYLGMYPSQLNIERDVDTQIDDFSGETFDD